MKTPLFIGVSTPFDQGTYRLHTVDIQATSKSLKIPQTPTVIHR